MRHIGKDYLRPDLLWIETISESILCLSGTESEKYNNEGSYDPENWLK